MTDSLRLYLLVSVALVLAYWLTTDSVWPHVVAALGWLWGHGGA